MFAYAPRSIHRFTNERYHPMSQLIRAFAAAGLLVCLPLAQVARGDDKDKSGTSAGPARAKLKGSQQKPEQPIHEVNLLDAARDGQVTINAEGRGDGRMTLSLTNNTRRRLRVVLPPGIIAQGATGQFGGMGGMGGGMGMMGGGMGGMGGGMGMMGGGMGGMGGGMGMMGGGMGGGGMMGGMGGMGRSSGTMPSTMGMMMLARMIMYFCGDPDSWDMRSLMIGMMGMRGMGGMGGGMGMMGGGMGGGMMGGMGGGMRSVAPTMLPSADLNPNQTRHLPTRLVSVTAPDLEHGLCLPEKGEPMRIVGDISQVNDDARVQKALRRLAAEKAPTSLSQLVMWNLAAGLDWSTIAQLSRGWSNRHELALAREFVNRLDSLRDGESGRLLIEVVASDAASQPLAEELSKLLERKSVLGLVASVSEKLSARPEAPAIACRVKLKAGEASVQVLGSDATASNWVPFGKFNLPVAQGREKFDARGFGDGFAEGVLNRLVRAQVIKGATTRERGKLVYQIRIENASPMVLNGLALLGTDSPASEMPKLLTGICVSPRRSLTIPANEQVVKTLGLKKGIKLTALDLSGL
jgi:hypothetical protein